VSFPSERRVRLLLLGAAVIIFAVLYASLLLTPPDVPADRPQHESGTPPVPPAHETIAPVA
jgi:hypothetical protein